MKNKLVVIFIVVVLLIAGLVFYCADGENTMKCYVLCKPVDGVYVYEEPNDSSEILYSLKCKDSFTIDGQIENGYVHIVNGGWVYCGYIVLQEPKQVMENYYCTRKRVAIREHLSGKVINWLDKRTMVTVFYTADGWACTPIGYIQLKYLKAE